MSQFDCDTIRDLLPSLVRGEMLPHEAASARHHLELCRDCSIEEALVRMLQEELAPIPAGLEARVIGEVRRRAVPQPRWTASGLALAATLAAAVLGGALLLQSSLRPTSGGANIVDATAVSWATAEDPLLNGWSALDDLSEDELERLLQEIDR